MLGSLLDDNPMALGVGALAIALLGGFGAWRFSKRAKKDSGETSSSKADCSPIRSSAPAAASGSTRAMPAVLRRR